MMNTFQCMFVETGVSNWEDDIEDAEEAVTKVSQAYEASCRESGMLCVGCSEEAA